MSDLQRSPKEAWSYLQQCGYHPTTTKAAYTILLLLAQREAQDRTQDTVCDMLSPALYDDHRRPNPRNKKQIWRPAKQMQYQRKLFSLKNRYGVVVTDPEQIAQEIVQNISSTMTQVSATEEECYHFLDSCFARHAHQPLYCMLSKPLTYDLIHAALDTLNKGSAPGQDGTGQEIYQHFHQHFVPRKLHIIQDFEYTSSLSHSWSLALLNPIPKTAGIPSGDLRPLVLQNSASSGSQRPFCFNSRIYSFS